MKHSYLKAILFALILLLPAFASYAQSNDDLLNLLIKKNVITEQDADSVRADLALKQQAQKDKTPPIIGIGKQLQVSGLIQTEYEGFQLPTKYNTFLVHRARLDVKGNITDDWSYEVYTEFAGVNPKLLDAYATYRITDYLKFTAGQFKVPFSAESLQSDADLDFIDRSQVVNALDARGTTDPLGNQNGRDVGIQLNGSFAKVNGHYLFDYYLGLFNGQGFDETSNDLNNHKDFAGRLVFHPITNLTIGADFYDGKDNYIIAKATTATNNKRDRQGLDAKYVLGKLALSGEYDKGTDVATKKDGWYGQATYFVWSDKLQLAARYDYYDPTEVTTSVASTATDATTNYIGGINYFFNKYVKFTVDYIYAREQTKTQINNNTVEAQLQLVF